MWGPSGPVPWRSHTRAHPKGRVSPHNRLCPSSSGRWNCWGRGLRRPRSPFCLLANRLLEFSPTRGPASGDNRPDQTQSLFRTKPSLPSCQLESDRQNPARSASSINLGPGLLPSWPPRGLHPVARMTYEARPISPRRGYFPGLIEPPVASWFARLRGRNSPVVRRKEQSAPKRTSGQLQQLVVRARALCPCRFVPRQLSTAARWRRCISGLTSVPARDPGLLHRPALQPAATRHDRQKSVARGCRWARP